MKKDMTGNYQINIEAESSLILQDGLLTKREIEIISLIAKGMTNEKIGKKLFISTSTVKTHRRNILSKTKCKGPVELANYAYSRGVF